MSRAFLDTARCFDYEAQCIAWVESAYPGATFFTVVTNQQRFTAIFPHRANKARVKDIARSGFYVVREEHLRNWEDARTGS